MSTMRLQPLTGEQLLERGLGDRGEINARPRPTPREVIAAWIGNAGVGIGAAVGTAVVLYVTKAPDAVLVTGSLLTGAAVFAGMMIWYGSIDERADWRNVRQVRKAYKMLAHEYAAGVKRLETQVDTLLDTIDEADAEVNELRRSLDQMTRERDLAIYDLTREREQAGQRSNGRNTYVPPVELAPQDIRDATEMIRYYYDTGKHLSRRKASEGKNWTQPRWEAAAQRLTDARVTTVTSGQTEYPQTLDEALQLFAAYMLQAKQLSVPTINKTVGKSVYVESEEA
jgi:FtsZ-binding cell division protein ZapB